MKRLHRPFAALSIVFAAGMFSTVATAQELDPLVNINFIVDPTSVVNCTIFEDRMPDDCDGLGNDGFPNYAYAIGVYVSREGGWPNGIGGLQFGIEYDVEGADVVVWTLCTGGAEIPGPGWPASGTGNAVTYPGGCHVPEGEVVLVGVLLFMRYDFEDLIGHVRVTADPRIGQAIYADCDPTSYEICEPNMASWTFATDVVPLCGNYCGGTPVEETTWGGIKSQYK